VNAIVCGPPCAIRVTRQEGVDYWSPSLPFDKAAVLSLSAAVGAEWT
jgi:hypothetical protein